MSYLNAERWRPRQSFTEECPPPGAYLGFHGPGGGDGTTPSRWLLELMDEEDQYVRVLIASDGGEWSEGDDER
jgi:hypothetical protein